MKKYIDAEGVMRACYDSFLKTGNKAYREIFALVEAVPAEDVQEVRHGRWEHDGYDFPHGNDWVHCSVCGKRGINVPADLTPYCPRCGSRMDKEENE